MAAARSLRRRARAVRRHWLTQAKYIQRINTTGGVAPATGCAVATDLGAIALVPYTTDYVFFRARR